jgi:hypothetical protein
MDNGTVCPEGKVRRRSYVRKNTGKTVRGTCVSLHKKECPPGTMRRSSYTRHVSNQSYTRKTKNGRSIEVHPHSYTSKIGPSCVKISSKTGRPKSNALRIGPLKKGELKKFGYSYKLPVEQRRERLQDAIDTLGPLNVYYKLHAVSELAKTKAPKASAVFMEDKKWIQNVYGPLNAF